MQQSERTKAIGFTALQNDFFEALPRFGFTGRQLNVMLVLVRKLIGFHKKQDDMSASQIGAACNTARQHVTTVLMQLRKMNVIFVKRGRYGSLIEINMDFSQWRKGAGQDLTQAPGKLEAHQPAPEEWVAAAGSDAVWQASSASHNSKEDEGVKPESIFLCPGRTDSGTLPLFDGADEPLSALAATDLVQLARPNVVHTKENLPKENTTKEKEPKKKSLHNAKAIDQAFAQFWQHYPKKVAKAEAYRQFCKLAPDEGLLASMLQALALASQQAQWSDPQMIPYPAKWLKRQSWLDELQTAYSEQEREAIVTFNHILGPVLGEVDSQYFVASRAGAIRHFLQQFSAPKDMARFFTYCREKCALPPRIGFDWLLKAENFTKVCEGQYEQRSVA
ncbi:replication protein [Massilia sp. W12]|uniref:replication protein n=1 Tax=Massilia sp. W12 TaxID=3126507 RepID=UPI0030CA80F3